MSNDSTKTPVNEDCNCGENGQAIQNSLPTFNKEVSSMEGKNVLLKDGRSGLIDDSIRNSRGEIIGYVLTGNSGPFRVYKEKVERIIDEQFDGAASLDATPGMGEIEFPTADHVGSGDVFSSAGYIPSKKNKKKSNTLLSWEKFLKKAKKSQQ